MESPQSSLHVAQLARKMNNHFKEQWGCGDPGTVATEYLTEGPCRLPKGIPRLALVSTLLDPRFKFRPGFSEQDKNAIWDIMRGMMTHVAMAEIQQQEEVENRDEGQPLSTMKASWPSCCHFSRA